jgi:hypothetical protein
MYITYKRNKQKTWYIFFQKINHFYFIRHITNNHVAAQYFGAHQKSKIRN